MASQYAPERVVKGYFSKYDKGAVFCPFSDMFHLLSSFLW